MEDKLYIDDIEDSNPIKEIIQHYVCISCGLTPKFKVGQPGPNGFNIDFKMQGWKIENNKSICPLCLRGNKIKEVLSHINKRNNIVCI